MNFEQHGFLHQTDYGNSNNINNVKSIMNLA